MKKNQKMEQSRNKDERQEFHIHSEPIRKWPYFADFRAFVRFCDKRKHTKPNII